MLASLKIENVAVIEKAEAHFLDGFNVLTGETGAGKSILIDSINAIVGNRVSRDLVRTGASKACIWATFEHIPAKVQQRLEQAGYECADDLLLYREIAGSGKSSCRINGMPATAAVVRDICEGLINIHGQHDSHNLTNPAKHLALLDAFAQNQKEHSAYYKVYRQLIAVKRECDSFQMDETEKQRKLEMLRFQVNEINNAQLTEGEEEQLAERKRIVAGAQTILDDLAAAHAALGSGDDYSGAADLLGDASGALMRAAQLDSSLQPASERLNELYYAVRDMASEFADQMEQYDFDPAELDAIEDRLDLIYRLKHKYGADIPAILRFGEEAQAELEKIEFSGERLAELEQQKKELFAQARQLAEVLTQTRLRAFEALNVQLIQALEFLNMPGIRFSLNHSRGPLASAGQDTIEFYISANPGEAPKPLAKIASGGELSRIMLAMKSAMAEKDDIPTIIYDEIDTGVSGLAASRIGEALCKTAKGRQVLCITHTAQIAAMADSHLLIQKNIEGERTYTEIYPLDEQGRVKALARIISGDHITELSLANAREMLGLAATDASKTAPSA